MKKSRHLGKSATVLFLVTGLFILSSCGSEVEQEEISLKGEKVSAEYMQKAKNLTFSSNDTTNSPAEVYEVNTNSSKAKIL
jgi:hypothetical protein